MKHKKPYSKYTSVYEIARGREDTEGNLLSPNRAIFATLCSVLSNCDDDRKRELLGESAYADMQLWFYDLSQRNILEFMDVATEAISVSFRKTVLKEVSLNAFPDLTQLVELPVYQDTDRRRALEKRISDPYSMTRLVAAKLRRKYFPAFAEFEGPHYHAMDVKMGLDRLVSGLKQWKDFL
ncbi:MAG: hypothetical protein KAK00_06980 [Nanoarchaeota archaeon]|nr:hypothetical protein [Nanoarchaeota archaeon]